MERAYCHNRGHGPSLTTRINDDSLVPKWWKNIDFKYQTQCMCEPSPGVLETWLEEPLAPYRVNQIWNKQTTWRCKRRSICQETKICVTQGHRIQAKHYHKLNSSFNATWSSSYRFHRCHRSVHTLLHITNTLFWIGFKYHANNFRQLTGIERVYWGCGPRPSLCHSLPSIMPQVEIQPHVEGNLTPSPRGWPLTLIIFTWKRKSLLHSTNHSTT